LDGKGESKRKHKIQRGGARRGGGFFKGRLHSSLRSSVWEKTTKLPLYRAQSVGTAIWGQKSRGGELEMRKEEDYSSRKKRF